jgi:hypothetical protein
MVGPDPNFAVFASKEDVTKIKNTINNIRARDGLSKLSHEKIDDVMLKEHIITNNKEISKAVGQDVNVMSKYRDYSYRPGFTTGTYAPREQIFAKALDRATASEFESALGVTKRVDDGKIMYYHKGRKMTQDEFVDLAKKSFPEEFHKGKMSAAEESFEANRAALMENMNKNRKLIKSDTGEIAKLEKRLENNQKQINELVGKPDKESMTKLSDLIADQRKIDSDLIRARREASITAKKIEDLSENQVRIAKELDEAKKIIQPKHPSGTKVSLSAADQEKVIDMAKATNAKAAEHNIDVVAASLPKNLNKATREKILTETGKISTCSCYVPQKGETAIKALERKYSDDLQLMIGKLTDQEIDSLRAGLNAEGTNIGKFLQETPQKMAAESESLTNYGAKALLEATAKNDKVLAEASARIGVLSGNKDLTRIADKSAELAQQTAFSTRITNEMQELPENLVKAARKAVDEGKVPGKLKSPAKVLEEQKALSAQALRPVEEIPVSAPPEEIAKIKEEMARAFRGKASETGLELSEDITNDLLKLSDSDINRQLRSSYIDVGLDEDEILRLQNQYNNLVDELGDTLIDLKSAEKGSVREFELQTKLDGLKPRLQKIDAELDIILLEHARKDYPLTIEERLLESTIEYLDDEKIELERKLLRRTALNAPDYEIQSIKSEILGVEKQIEGFEEARGFIIGTDAELLNAEKRLKQSNQALGLEKEEATRELTVVS